MPSGPSDPPSRAVSGGRRPSGLVLSPFRALRPDPAVAGPLEALTSPPYDVVDEAEAAALEALSDHNVVRLILPRGAADGADSRYARAAALLRAWRDSGALTPDDAPALYVYEQGDPSGAHVQRGLLGALALSPPEDGIVLPHESTMSGTVSDRLALYTAVEADLEPIFLVYDGGGAATELVAAVGSREPLVDVVLPDGLRHRLWAVSDPGELDAVAADLHPRTALIADGHHRYATYLQRQALHDEAGPWDAGLTFLVDATSFGPEVHPIHRVVVGVEAAELARRSAGALAVHDLDGSDLEEGLAALAQAGTAGPAFLLVSGDGGTVRLLTTPDAERLEEALGDDRSAAWKALDVSVLHGFVVPAVWGVEDTVDVVRYAHDAEEAVALAASTGGAAVLLNPTPVEAVAAVARQGERMPRKSTLFTPKPRTGLVVRDHRDA
jgi:uncharacterized protein (DUF1015 family)